MVYQIKKESDKFIKEFQISFNSSLWELYLNKAFLDLGFKIDYSKESPDFNLIDSSGRIINVEAVNVIINDQMIKIIIHKKLIKNI